MNSENNQINLVLCSYHFEKNDLGDNKKIRVAEKTTLEVPEDDANDKKLLCSLRMISKSRKYLLEIKNELKKANRFLSELFSMLFGISLSLLLSLWTSIDVYSKIGFWVYIFLTILTIASLFMWIFFRKNQENTANQKIDFILNDLLPNSEKTTSVMEEK